MIEIKALKSFSREKLNSKLKELEGSIEYPYGGDSFHIDHGSSYFSFFERLGTIEFNLALDGQRVVACACGIKRSIPRGQSHKKAWYLCDLKVHHDFRKRKIPRKLFTKNLLRHFFSCPRGYTISMNPSEGQNRVIKLIESFPFFPLKFSETLYLFEVSMDEVKSIEEEVNAVLGEPVRFLSLKGVKDIVLKSTQEAIPLFHAQYGPMASPEAKAIEHEGRYMFCTPKNSCLYKLLSKYFSSSATASILEYGLRGQSWDFILSSDI